MGTLEYEDPQWLLCSKKCHVFMLCLLFAKKEAIASAVSLIMFGVQSYKVHGFAVREVHHLIFFIVMFPAAVYFIRSVPKTWRTDPSYTPKGHPIQAAWCDMTPTDYECIDSHPVAEVDICTIASLLSKPPFYKLTLLPMLIYLCCLPLSVLDLIAGIILNSAELARNETANPTFTGIAIAGACISCGMTVFSLYVTARAYKYAKLQVQGKSQIDMRPSVKA